MQDIFPGGRILTILYPSGRNAGLEKKRMRKKKRTGVGAWLRSRPFTVLAFGLALMMTVLVVQLPKRMGALERQDEQLTRAMAYYSEQQAQSNVLQNELTRVNNADYVEKVARREHGFGWYGETIYEIANLDEIQAQQAEQGE